MNYDNNRSTIRENKGYKNRYDSNAIRRRVAEEIDAQKYKDASIERKTARAILIEKEKHCTEQLLELGKLCAYIEGFDNISISEQKIPQVGPFENPIECESFQKGYAHGKMLVKNGLPIESYHQHSINYENKYLSNYKQK